MFQFLSKKKSFDLISPVSGNMIPLEEVEDQVFSSKMMGEGVAFELSNGIISSPIEGVIEMIPSTLHAIGIKGRNGLEVLIHVGLDTVNLAGVGFSSLIKQGEKVKVGTPLLKVDIKSLKNMGVILTTPMIITNSSDYLIEIKDVREVENGKTIVIECKKKK